MPLGFPAGREDISNNPEAVRSYIEQLSKDFSLIMLVEYFSESLILLKRKMCWSFYDIVYRIYNNKDYYFKKENSHLDLVPIYRNWSAVDYQLYDHFNRTFWRQVGEESSDFFDEVAEYKKVQTELSEFCDVGGSVNFTMVINKWSSGFTIVREDCKLLWPDLLKRIQARHNEEEKALLEKVDMQDHPAPQGLC